MSADIIQLRRTWRRLRAEPDDQFEQRCRELDARHEARHAPPPRTRPLLVWSERLREAAQ